MKIRSIDNPPIMYYNLIQEKIMRQIIAISLPLAIKKEVDSMTAKEGISRSDLIRQSIKDYLFVHQFRALRNKMISKAKAQGIYTDQDVFDRAS